MTNPIYINARFLTQQVTGVQRFAIEICKELKKSIPNVVFVAPSNILQVDLAKELGVVSFGKLPSHLWEQIELPLYLKKNGNPLLLNLCNTAPLSYKNQIITIHDLAFKVNPKWFSLPFSLYYNFLIPKISKISKHIFTVSNASKTEISHLLQIDEKKINVIYNGVSSIFSKKSNTELPANLKDIEYFLAVSSLDPRKNLLHLVKAFNELADNHYKLIIVGSESKIFADVKLKNLITANSNILFTGYVNDDLLLALYSHAKALVYPSLYEGFGIPPIEAMSCGCPVIVSAIPSLKEVCGENAMYINPHDVHTITTAMQEIIASNRPFTYQVNEQFNWQISASKIAKILEKFRKIQ